MSDVEKCSECGKKFGGFMGVSHVCDSTHADFVKHGKDVKNVCSICCNAISNKIKNDKCEKLKELRNSFNSTQKDILDKVIVFTTPHPIEWQKGIKGIVSGHAVIGTGAVVEIISAWTDFFGKDSLEYAEKITKCEERAIAIAKLKAIDLGANCISGMTISVSEATKGNGMIMVSCLGTALDTGESFESMNKLKEIIKEIEQIENKPNIIIAETEENYEQLFIIESQKN